MVKLIEGSDCHMFKMRVESHIEIEGRNLGARVMLKRGRRS